jgi:hypothetical protein
MPRSFLPNSPEIQAAAKAAGINAPYYGVEVEGDSFRFYLYGGSTVLVRALPGFGDTAPQATPQAGAAAATARPQRPKPTITITGNLHAMSKAELCTLAAKLGINLRSKATKAEIAKLIMEVKP